MWEKKIILVLTISTIYCCSILLMLDLSQRASEKPSIKFSEYPSDGRNSSSIWTEGRPIAT
jgi:hypothetical protein